MRRGFRRSFRRALGEAPQVPAALQDANQLMASGDYPAAAAAFEDLARLAEARGGPHAPFFLMQAGRARLLIGEHGRSMAHFKHGLTLLADAKRYTLFYRAGTRIAQELTARKLDKEAQEIANLVHHHTAAIAEMSTEPLPRVGHILPTHCPSCGGPVRSDETDWIDERTVECPFCGSPVRAE